MMGGAKQRSPCHSWGHGAARTARVVVGVQRVPLHGAMSRSCCKG